MRQFGRFSNIQSHIGNFSIKSSIAKVYSSVVNISSYTVYGCNNLVKKLYSKVNFMDNKIRTQAVTKLLTFNMPR